MSVLKGICMTGRYQLPWKDLNRPPKKYRTTLFIIWRFFHFPLSMMMMMIEYHSQQQYLKIENNSLSLSLSIV